LVVATGLGILIGRTIRLRDRQFPGGQQPDRPAGYPETQIPTQNTGERGRRPGN
jgi:hypothetical protein